MILCFIADKAYKVTLVNNLRVWGPAIDIDKSDVISKTNTFIGSLSNDSRANQKEPVLQAAVGKRE